MPTFTASTTAQEVFPRNKNRKSFIILNEDTSIAVFIKRERDGATVTSTDHDYRVGPPGSLVLNNLNDGVAAIQDRWTIIAASGTPRIAWFETEDLER